MNVEEFSQGLQFLIHRFRGGEDFYDRDFSEYLWGKVQELDGQLWQKKCRQLGFDRRAAPVMGEILTHVAPDLDALWRNRREALDTTLDKLTDCHACGNSGSVRAWRKRDIKHRAAFRCGFCKRAERRNEFQQLPEWTRANHKSRAATWIPQWDDPENWSSEMQRHWETFAAPAAIKAEQDSKQSPEAGPPASGRRDAKALLGPFLKKSEEAFSKTEVGPTDTDDEI